MLTSSKPGLGKVIQEAKSSKHGKVTRVQNKEHAYLQTGGNVGLQNEFDFIAEDEMYRSNHKGITTLESMKKFEIPSIARLGTLQKINTMKDIDSHEMTFGGADMVRHDLRSQNPAHAHELGSSSSVVAYCDVLPAGPRDKVFSRGRLLIQSA